MDEIIQLTPGPQGLKKIRWPSTTMHQGTSVLSYGPYGWKLAQGSTGGDVLLRNADTGYVEQRLIGLHKTVYGLLFTADHLWAGGDDNQLARWPLLGSLQPDLPLFDEGSTIFDLAATRDGRFLIAALGDGRAAVHALPDGALIAHLIPFSDGSWATLYADGHFEAAPGRAPDPTKAASLAYRLEDPASRRSIPLGNLSVPVSFGQISTTRLAEGSLRVRASVFSPNGPPEITLDRRWPLPITPSRTSLSAYEFEILLSDPSDTPHELAATPPEGEPARASFTPPPEVRERTRALVIGNGAYRDRPLPGALKDAEAVADALGKSWGLPPNRLLVRKDLDTSSMGKAMKDFFASASPGETLLLYFAGHGDHAGNEGYLFPADFTDQHPERRIAASTLLGWIKTSKASQIVLVLDACHAGSFALPPEAEQKNLRNKVLLLASTAVGSAARDTENFTQAFLKAFQRPESIDPRFHGVTIRKAFAYADDVVDQSPRMWGSPDLENIVLARPSRPAGPSVSTIGRGAINGTLLASLKVSGDTEPTRQATARGDTSGAGAQRRINVQIAFGDETESLRILAYPDLVTKEPDVLLVWTNPHDRTWKKNEQTTIPVYLDDRFEPGRYKVEVEPCAPGNKCGTEPLSTFAVELK